MQHTAREKSLISNDNKIAFWPEVSMSLQVLVDELVPLYVREQTALQYPLKSLSCLVKAEGPFGVRELQGQIPSLTPILLEALVWTQRQEKPCARPLIMFSGYSGKLIQPILVTFPVSLPLLGRWWRRGLFRACCAPDSILAVFCTSPS